MDAIITKILEIDHRARDIVKEAEHQFSDGDEIIAAEKEKLHQQIMQEGVEKLAAAKESLLSKAKKEAETHAENSARRIAEMEAQFNAEKEAWVEELYRRITEIG